MVTTKLPWALTPTLEDIHIATIPLSAKSPPVLGEMGQAPSRASIDPPQAQINRSDAQGLYFHSEEPPLVTAEQVMNHIIFELLQEPKIRGPIGSALQNVAYNQPHQVILIDPRCLYTNRTKSGEYIEDEDGYPLPESDVKALLNLQAYHNATFMKGNEDDDDFFLDWNIWMGIPHTDLMKFQLLSKRRADCSDKWDREN